MTEHADENKFFIIVSTHMPLTRHDQLAVDFGGELSVSTHMLFTRYDR